MPTNKYDEKSIQHLEGLEHIRKRPGMYIGKLGDGSQEDDGIYILMKEVLDNSIDEHITGYGNLIILNINDNRVSVRDYGRGIPLKKVVECVSLVNTGAKYDTEVFQYSVGLNGIGTKAVNALSKSFLVRSYREGKFFQAYFEGGELIDTKEGKTDEADGTFIQFLPDKKFFPNFKYDDEFVCQRIQNYCYLYTKLTIQYNGKNFKSKNGLLDLLTKEVGDSSLYDIVHYVGKTTEFSFTHKKNSSSEQYFSYANGQFTPLGGTHQMAFKEGLLKGINEFFVKNWSAQDIRDGIIGAISIRLQNPIFESQTKTKLSNPEIKAKLVEEVKTAVLTLLRKSPETAQNLSKKIQENVTLHKQISDLRQVSRSDSNRRINIPKLKDCKFHLNQGGKNSDLGEKSMIFLTEGDSASGTLNTARDVMTQAVFSLRGKPMNVFGKSKAEMLKNEELKNVMEALGIKSSIDGLRYGKVIFATDADIDGFHIRILLLTYFLSFFEDLVRAGRVWILDTPLFRVRNKTVTTYCYSEEERDRMVKQIRSAEVTRFKGLGEISAKEFGQFIGEDMRLIPVTIENAETLKSDMEFYMGNNTPQRRDFIMNYLI